MSSQQRFHLKNSGRCSNEWGHSVISGSLASPKPPGGGEPEERGDEKNETQSRGDLQGAGSIGRGQRRQDADRIGRALWRPSPQITEWKQQLLARAADVFGGTKPTADTPDLKTLHAKIGQLALENDFLEGEKKTGTFYFSDRSRRRID